MISSCMDTRVFKCIIIIIIIINLVHACMAAATKDWIGGYNKSIAILEST